jgi:hypothetical protein
LVDPLIDEGLDPKEIWVRIIDEHHISVPFTPVVNYAKERQLRRDRPRNDQETARLGSETAAKFRGM